MAWHLPKDFSEFLVSFWLCIGFLSLYVAIKRQAFGINTRLLKVSFSVIGIMGVYVASTFVGYAFTSSHAWGNPSYGLLEWMKAGVLPGEHGTETATIIFGVQSTAFMIIGAIAGGVAWVVGVSGWNKFHDAKHQIVLAELFQYTEKSAIRNGLTSTSAMTVAALIMTIGSSDLTADAKLLRPLIFAMVAGIYVVLFGLDGVAMLNPVIWIGFFISKICAQKRITGQQFLSEFAIPIGSALAAFAVGWLIFGVNQLPA